MLSRLFYTAITLAPGAGATTQEAGAAVAPKDGATDAPQNGAEQADLSLSTIQDVRSFDDLQEAGTALVDVFQSYALLYIPKLIFAIIALVLGLFIVKVLVSLTGRAFKVREVEKSVSIFVQSVMRVGLKIVVFIMVLGILGVPTASLGFILGAASLAVGFALKDTLQNFAGGVIILLLKPYRIGDFIEAKGFSGTIQQIQIFNTVMTTGDNRRVIIPNGQLSTSALINYSMEDTRRVDLTIGIGYSDDIDHAREVLMRLLSEDSRTHKDPEPMVQVENLGDSSVDIMVRAWVDRGDFLTYKLEFLRKVKQAFDAEGISIPYPQSEVSVRQVTG